jgi:hypothetical protein
MIFRTRSIHLRSSARLFLPTCLGPLLLLGAAFAAQACAGDDGSGTSGKRVVLHTRVELAEGETQFTTAVGWSVEIERASLATGALYYFEGVSPIALHSRASGWQLAARWLGLGVAHAHPGHYEPGGARGQMLEPFSVDLLAGPAEFPDGEGVSGLYRSARFSFSAPPVGPAVEQLAEHAAFVQGRAELAGEEPRFFRGVAEFDEIKKIAAEGRVEGCKFNKVNVDADGTVTVLVHPRVWFNLVDFSELEPGSEDEPVEFPIDSQPRIAFVQGLAELSAYEFSYLPE